MNSLLLAVTGIAMIVTGYLVYSRYLAQRIYALDDSRPTPAHTERDGVDYVPTNKVRAVGFTTSRRWPVPPRSSVPQSR